MRRRTQPLAFGFSALALAVFGCTTLVGLDKDYVAEPSILPDGSAGEAGVRDAGFDGMPASCTSSADCGDRKCCGPPEGSGLDPKAKLCVEPGPSVGCSNEFCTPCPGPAHNGIAVCRDRVCAIECNFGSTEVDGDCVATGDAGTVPSCTATSCPPCTMSIFGPLGCCRPDGTCGCTIWAALYCG